MHAKRGKKQYRKKWFFFSDTMACLHARESARIFEYKCNGKWHIFKSAVFSFHKQSLFCYENNERGSMSADETGFSFLH